ILAKQQRIKCVGFGAKTKWYFTLNALIREFIGYLSLTRKRHALVIGIVAVLVVLVKGIG
ncbi:MAG: YdcF family protein, partial [Eisenbergiella massiliensis]|nr:YdcF family protein [Eisenbergiella massiliensis]